MMLIDPRLSVTLGADVKTKRVLLRLQVPDALVTGGGQRGQFNFARYVTGVELDKVL